MFIQAAIPVPVHRTFTYAVPPGLRSEVSVGKRVLVPFGKKKTTGYIVEIGDRADGEDTKDIIEILDEEPLFSPEDLRFYEWAAAYYLYPLGPTLKTVLPSGIHREGGLWISPCLTADPGGRISSRERDLLRVIGDRPGGLAMKTLKKAFPHPSLNRWVEALRKRGLVEIQERITPPRVKRKRDLILTAEEGPVPPDGLKKQERRLWDRLHQEGGQPLSGLRGQFRNLSSLIRRLEEKGHIRIREVDVYRQAGPGPRIGGRRIPSVLTDEQEAALGAILEEIGEDRYVPFLLHGVTGSGKTEVYLRAAREAVQKGGGVLFLVPEIALTPQLLGRVRDHFREEEIAVLHSGVSPSEKFDAWRRIRKGLVKIVVGARSAVFAPLPKLKLIICDEEHDPSYKQDDRFMYSGRDLAVVKARMSRAAVILGSATPGVQTFFNTEKRGFRYLALTRRVDDRPLPSVKIVDMKREREDGERLPLFSSSLKTAMAEALSAGRQTLLFLNRRGFETFLFCPSCGHVFRCLNCSVSMTHHAREGLLRCHYCNFAVKPPPLCPNCQGTRILSHGMGTEKVEEETKRLFPGARVERMDSDTTEKRGAYEKILERFDQGDTDILIGTQMITKGHDFPNVTLVGVVSADLSLNLPDFRAAERTFQVLTQVSGRGGRGDFPGQVIIQTIHPGHYAIGYAENHDFQGFYREEIKAREELLYPPYSRMVNLKISGLHPEKVFAAARDMASRARDRIEALGDPPPIVVMGPSEAPLGKLKGRHRWQLLLMGKEVKSLHGLAAELLESAGKKGVEVRGDVDPLNFM